MNNLKLLTSIALCDALLVFGPVTAQTVKLDAAAIETGCAVSASACMVAVQTAIIGLEAAGLPAEAFNSQLGIVAGIALDASEPLPAVQRAEFASVLTEVAEASSNQTQSRTLRELARAIQAGEALDLEAVGTELSRS